MSIRSDCVKIPLAKRLAAAFRINTGPLLVERIHFMGSAKPAAQQAVDQLIDRYGQSDFAVANYLVAIGGDGTALRGMHAALSTATKAVFAMRLPGSWGALGNSFHLEKLPERLQASHVRRPPECPTRC
jgi:NAD+ kinase